MGLALLVACGNGANSQFDPCNPSAQRVNRTPNFVVFMTDDQTTEQLRVMPQVRRLIADRGVSFSNMVVNDANCCPSRATFLTGQQSRHHGVLWNSPPSGGFAAFEHQETTLPVALREAGYRTGYVGKYMNRYGERGQDRYVPPGWDDFQGLVWPADSIYFDVAFYDNNKVVETGSDVYVTHEITKRSLSMVESFARSGQPFFIMIGHVAPHNPAGIPLSEVIPQRLEMQILSRNKDSYPVPEPKYVGKFKEERLPSSPSFNEKDVSDKAKIVQRDLMDTQKIEQVTDEYRGALESLLSVDDSVASVVDELERNCVLNNTFVLYTSDNGRFFGEHRFPSGKYFPYLPARSVPLLIRGPNIPEGEQRSSVVSNVDFAPTIAELAGATLLRESDGVSLRELLVDNAVERGRAVYLEGHAPVGLFILPFDAVYSGDLLLMEMSNGEQELYDLSADPYELNNLVSDPAARPLLIEASQLLTELRNCRGATCGTIGSGRPVPEP